MKVVYNDNYGGFNLSDKAILYLCQLKGIPVSEYDYRWYYGDWVDYQNRADPDLIATIEALGEKAGKHGSILKIREIPDESDFDIAECDGLEMVVCGDEEWPDLR
ncbi:hypothetical protein J0O85_00190 [Listeria monocytogenes]|nr:hypothetical protein [Listeria monocytogenes]NVR90521.1 hypothetical protein [Listeria monocytogenes]NVS23102.1 hypothetical protein [Listeria monocytogenes]